MLFRQLFHQESGTYTYLLGCEESKKATIIDPVLENSQQYLKLIEQLDLNLSMAIDTHTHADHVTALGELRDLTGCTTVMGEHSKADCVSKTVGDGDVLEIGSIELKCLYTPGHTNESFSFVSGNRVFTGDVLLIRGSGRTDFQGGDAGASWDSIQGKLFTLPEQTLVYPAHDYKGWTVSSIAEEKRHNPRLTGKNRQQYIDIMNNLDLPDPKMMDIAVPANLRCGRSS
ncbi:MAG: MBL fold metallo-hydrolase [Gammaproteobacteria bacterium]|nr:MBL fold metallo-hydrolase [Gammaproteobacteria bacterium]NND38972.1 MBL fold metallo-hydrolase [Pseudomonadales bacterium]NNL11580.1 MBL fold metallo-hydrolase [Pseudomonadales bacterium]NNM10964.1 MBL fold metallo-hydrolase [Pseudomonadales bacterium]